MIVYSIGEGAPKGFSLRRRLFRLCRLLRETIIYITNPKREALYAK